MITNTGKNILAKYLIGQAPAYASYIAIGCGPKPLIETNVSVTNKEFTDGIHTLTTSQAHGFEPGSRIIVSGVEGFNGEFAITDVPSETTFITDQEAVGDPVSSTAVSPAGLVSIDYRGKETLDFEMFRVPIISRGYVNDNGVPQVVFTAELPTEERYEITEVGVYSAGSNPAAGSYDSRTIYNFTQSESWQYHTLTEARSIPVALGQLDDGGTENEIPDTYRGNDMSVFQTNADNILFTYPDRVARYERPRFFNNVVVVQGDTADLGFDVNDKITTNSGSEHIHLTGVNLDLDKNAPTDRLKLAFSVLNKTGGTIASPTVTVPDNVKVMIEFASTDVSGEGEYARFEVNLDNGTGDRSSVYPFEYDTKLGAYGEHNFENSRYIVVEKELQELTRSSGFTWSIVDVVLMYVCVSVDDEGTLVPSEDYYVAVDSLRLDNVTTRNPLYGLTGYTAIKNNDALPVVKAANSTNFVEFRFAIGVD